MIGVSALSGNALFTMSSLSRTSFVSTSMSLPYSNSSVITDMFSRDFEVMCFRSLTAFRLFSSGRVTFCSMSAALAPEYEVITIKVLVSMSGYRSMGSVDSENRPMITTATKHNVVMIGRLTALAYKLISLGLQCFGD